MTDEELKRLEIRYSDMESWDDAKRLALAPAASPEVPAPDEVWLVVHPNGKDILGDTERPEDWKGMGANVVRYVRAREGGR